MFKALRYATISFINTYERTSEALSRRWIGLRIHLESGSKMLIGVISFREDCGQQRKEKLSFRESLLLEGWLDLLMKVREVIKPIEEDGWYRERNRGNHRQVKHPTKSCLFTIGGKPSDDAST